MGPLSAEINEVRLWHGTRGQNFKSIQYADNAETPTVILSRVLLGRSYDLEPQDHFNDMDATGFRRFQSEIGQYESWRATPGKANSGDQMHKEYIVPDEAQVYPEYVIELKRRA